MKYCGFLVTSHKIQPGRGFFGCSSRRGPVFSSLNYLAESEGKSRMRKFLIAGIAVAAFCAAPAFAADMPTKGPVYKAAPAPVFNWTGFYSGAVGTYGWGDS